MLNDRGRCVARSLTYPVPGPPELQCSSGGRLASKRVGGTEVSASCDGSASPMSAVYPVHLQKEIDRRWLQRSEEAVSVRARRSGGVSQERSNGVSDLDLRLSRRFGIHWRSERGIMSGESLLVVLAVGKARAMSEGKHNSKK